MTALPLDVISVKVSKNLWKDLKLQCTPEFFGHLDRQKAQLVVKANRKPANHSAATQDTLEFDDLLEFKVSIRHGLSVPEGGRLV